MATNLRLRQILASVRSAADLTALFAALGYRPDNTPSDNGWVSVARWRGYRVLATTSPSPADAVARAARRLAASARPVLLAAVGDDGLLVIGAPPVGGSRRSRLLAVSRNRPSPFALRQLAALAPGSSANALHHALRVADQLASEEVSERFYVAFRDLLLQMIAHLGRKGDKADRTLAALLPLTRVLFLYFIQEKGWLDGRRDYLRVTLDAALARGRHFHRSVLHPLFFGTLNRPRASRSRHAVPGEVPYLNGGLFEPHAVERRLGPVLFPNRIWRDAFDRVFDRFRFCVREASEVDAIAPDMLGRVFERVMDVAERHATGTFYTPEPVVRQVVCAALATSLARPCRLAQPEMLMLLNGEAPPRTDIPATRRALRALTVLDPAVGSGAFLLGALECLTDANIAIGGAAVEQFGGRRRDDGHLTASLKGRVRRRILRENLFGVDLNPIAVRLAELRLWLAVVAHDPTADIRAVEPLPNLDGIVQQGDALLDPLGAARSLGLSWHGAPRQERAVRHARDAVFLAGGAEQKRRAHALRTAENIYAGTVVRGAIESVRDRLRDLATLARSRDLFGNRTGLLPAQERQHAELKRRLAELRKAARALQDGQVPFFAFEVHRPDVMSRGGFSVVLGNPPWVRAECLPATVRTELSRRFTWWRNDSEITFKHQPDLAVAFLQRACELTAPGGAVGVLVPAKLCTASYGAAARGALVRETTVAYLHRVTDKDAARFGAVAYPLALVLRKEPPTAEHQIKLQFDASRTLSQRRLDGGPWILIRDRWHRDIRALERAGSPLATVVRPVLGVKTGADTVFLGCTVGATGRTRLVRFGKAEREMEARLLRPAVRGRDVGPFRVSPSRSLVWCYDSNAAPLERVPRLARAHFAEHRSRLQRRSDYRGGPVWSLFRLSAAVPGHRVVWPDIAREPAAAVLEALGLEQAIPLNSCYIACCETRTLALTVTGILNSTWARLLTRLTADEARGGYRRHNAQVVGRVPLPPCPADGSPLALAAAAAHERNAADPDEIDRLAADALGLSARLRTELLAVARDSG